MSPKMQYGKSHKLGLRVKHTCGVVPGQKVTARLHVLANVAAGKQAAPTVQTLPRWATAVERNCRSATKADDIAVLTFKQ